MIQALKLLMVVAVGVGLAVYGHIKGAKERQADRRDPRQQPLFPQQEHNPHSAELAPR
jgi:hypothetical protein